jgi:hypothetical protein
MVCACGERKPMNPEISAGAFTLEMIDAGWHWPETWRYIGPNELAAVCPACWLLD